MVSASPPPAVSRQAWSVLIVSTLAFTVCFMVWMMFGVIGIPLQKQLGLSGTEFGLLTALPVLSGSLVRVPLGIWTDRYGGRIVMTMLMACTVPAIWAMAYATQYWHFLVIGLFVGLAGGAFSVGTPYVARWFPKSRQGMAMGVYGAGNSGSAVNKFLAPALLVAGGWVLVPKVYAAIMLGTVILFWFFSAHDPKHLVANNARFATQAAYDTWVPALEALFQQHGGDWRQFYAAARQLAALPTKQRQQALCALHPQPGVELGCGAVQ